MIAALDFLIITFHLLIGYGNFNNSNNIVRNNTDKRSVILLKESSNARSHITTTIDKRITITVSYSAIECGCPQWFLTKFKNIKFLNGVERFYLEPTNKSLINADGLWDGKHLPLTLRLTGKFSKEKELPKTYRTKGTPEKARIFWYDKIIIISHQSSNQ